MLYLEDVTPRDLNNGKTAQLGCVSQVHVAECPDTQAPEPVLYPEDVTPRDLNQAVDHARRLRDLAEASSAPLPLSVLDVTQQMVDVCNLATRSDHAHRPGRGIQCAQAAMKRNKTDTHRVVKLCLAPCAPPLCVPCWPRPPVCSCNLETCAARSLMQLRMYIARHEETHIIK